MKKDSNSNSIFKMKNELFTKFKLQINLFMHTHSRDFVHIFRVIFYFIFLIFYILKFKNRPFKK